MTHTPGPWFVGTLNDALFIINRAPRPSHDDMADIRDVQVIAKLNNCKGDDDARLIAAAPAMLSALREIAVIAEQNIHDLCAIVQEDGVLSAMDKMELRRWQSVGEAIAKAEGDKP